MRSVNKQADDNMQEELQGKTEKRRQEKCCV